MNSTASQQRAPQTSTPALLDPKSATLGYLAKNEDYMWKRIKHEFIQKVAKESSRKGMKSREDVEDYIYAYLKELIQWVKQDGKLRGGDTEGRLVKLKKEMEVMGKAVKDGQERVKRRDDKIARMEKTVAVFMDRLSQNRIEYPHKTPKQTAETNLLKHLPALITQIQSRVDHKQMQQITQQLISQLIALRQQQVQQQGIQHQLVEQVLDRNRLVGELRALVKLREGEAAVLRGLVGRRMEELGVCRERAGQFRDLLQGCLQENGQLRGDLQSKQRVIQQLEQTLIRLQEQYLALQEQQEGVEAGKKEELEQTIANIQIRKPVLSLHSKTHSHCHTTSTLTSQTECQTIPYQPQQQPQPQQQEKSQQQYIQQCDRGTQYDPHPHSHTAAQTVLDLCQLQQQLIAQQGQISKLAQQLQQQKDINLHDRQGIAALKEEVELMRKQQYLMDKQIETLRIDNAGLQFQLGETRHRLIAYLEQDYPQQKEEGKSLRQLQQSISQLQIQNAQLKKNNQQLLDTIEYANSLFNSNPVDRDNKLKLNHLSIHPHPHPHPHPQTKTLTETSGSHCHDLSEKSDKDNEDQGVLVSKYEEMLQEAEAGGNETESSDSYEGNGEGRYGEAVARILADFINVDNSEESKMSAFATLLELLRPGGEIGEKLNEFAKLRKSRSIRTESMQGQPEEGLKDRLYKFLTSN